MTLTRECSRCHQKLPLSAFYRWTLDPVYGRQRWCRVCQREHAAFYRSTPHGRAVKARIQRKYHKRLVAT